MSDDPVVQSPARLIDEPTEVASILTESEAQFRTDLDEGRAWKKLEPSLGVVTARRRRPGVILTSALTSAVAMAIGWYAGAHYAGKPDYGKVTAPVPTAAVGAATVTKTVSRPLQSGESLFEDGTRAVVGEGTQGQFTNGPDGTNVQLLRGDLELFVARQAKGQQFSVQCPDTELRVLGTHFAVSVAEDCVQLRVLEGKVAVISKNIQVEPIGAGQRWASHACEGRVQPTAQ